MRRFLAAFLCLILLSTPALAQDKQAKSEFSAAERAEIDARIKQFILDNPQALIQSVENYYNKQTDTKKSQSGDVEQFPAGLLDYPLTPFVGPKDAKIAVVEFFDYNCGYCKQAANDLARLIEEEKGSVKFLFKELPILSDSSELAARYALAANRQGKYLEYHLALMNSSGGYTEASLEATARQVGLDVEKLKKDANSQDVRDALAKNMELARELGVRGTPFFVIGKKKVPGAIGYTQMLNMLRTERGDQPLPEAPTPSASTTSGVTKDSIVQPSGLDEEAAADLEAAKDEAKKMVEDLKKQAAEMQAEAAKMMEEAKKAQAAEAAAKKE